MDATAYRLESYVLDFKDKRTEKNKSLTKGIDL